MSGLKTNYCTSTLGIKHVAGWDFCQELNKKKHVTFPVFFLVLVYPLSGAKKKGGVSKYYFSSCTLGMYTSIVVQSTLPGIDSSISCSSL